MIWGDRLTKRLERDGAFARRDLMPIARLCVIEFWPDHVAPEITAGTKRAMRSLELRNRATDRVCWMALRGEHPYTPLQSLIAYVAISAGVPASVVATATKKPLAEVCEINDEVDGASWHSCRLAHRLVRLTEASKAAIVDRPISIGYRRQAFFDAVRADVERH